MQQLFYSSLKQCLQKLIFIPTGGKGDRTKKWLKNILELRKKQNIFVVVDTELFLPAAKLSTTVCLVAHPCLYSDFYGSGRGFPASLPPPYPFFGRAKKGGGAVQDCGSPTHPHRKQKRTFLKKLYTPNRCSLCKKNFYLKIVLGKNLLQTLIDHLQTVSGRTFVCKIIVTVTKFNK